MRARIDRLRARETAEAGIPEPGAQRDEKQPLPHFDVIDCGQRSVLVDGVEERIPGENSRRAEHSLGNHHEGAGHGGGAVRRRGNQREILGCGKCIQPVMMYFTPFLTA